MDLSQPCTPGIHVPDENGEFILYARLGDLVNGIRNNEKLELWRRDGSILLQKYARFIDEVTAELRYKPTMIYSVWDEELDKMGEYFEIGVKIVPNSLEVRILYLDKLEDEWKDEKKTADDDLKKEFEDSNPETEKEIVGSNSELEMEEQYLDVEYLEEEDEEED